ncbi:MAG: hypothetical protein ACREC9_15085, partial [Methylocella sp.]
MAATPTRISTVVVPAVANFSGGAQYDLAALADVKLELQITDSLNDVWLGAVISRVSSAISDYCNRIFQLQIYQDMFYAKRDPYPWQVPGGVMPLQLRAWPIVAAISPAGIPPPPAPILSAVAGGSLAAATYYARATYLTAAGETAASLESRLIVAANNLLNVAPPPLDQNALAAGWNVYVAAAAFVETKQNATPLLLSATFTEPSAGLISGAAIPNYVTAVENFAPALSPVNNGVTPPGLPPLPQPLAEGVDFLVDARFGQLSRLYPDGYPHAWPPLPIVIQYQAGFATIPFDLQEAVIRMVKARWYMRTVN